VLPYNDEKALAAFFKKNRDLACAIAEPVAANMGVIPATKNFLALLREQTKKTGALLIFDEVITGFRLTYGGAQHVYGIRPDLTVLGKIIGGGLPIGAFGGPESVMRRLAPLGRVYQAGTLSGNPLSMAAGRSALSRLSKGVYEKLNGRAEVFALRLESVLGRKKPVHVNRLGSMFTAFYTDSPPANFADLKKADARAFRRVFHGLLRQGVYTPPSAFEASFLSTRHTPEVLEKTLDAYKRI
jgi:glutamate-1-semialdehyde 2,1-aminomutase